MNFFHLRPTKSKPRGPIIPVAGRQQVRRKKEAVKLGCCVLLEKLLMANPFSSFVRYTNQRRLPWDGCFNYQFIIMNHGNCNKSAANSLFTSAMQPIVAVPPDHTFTTTSSDLSCTSVILIMAQIGSAHLHLSCENHNRLAKKRNKQAS